MLFCCWCCCRCCRTVTCMAGAWTRLCHRSAPGTTAPSVECSGGPGVNTGPSTRQAVICLAFRGGARQMRICLQAAPRAQFQQAAGCSAPGDGPCTTGAMNQQLPHPQSFTLKALAGLQRMYRCSRAPVCMQHSCHTVGCCSRPFPGLHPDQHSRPPLPPLMQAAGARPWGGDRACRQDCHGAQRGRHRRDHPAQHHQGGRAQVRALTQQGAAAGWGSRVAQGAAECSSRVVQQGCAAG